MQRDLNRVRSVLDSVNNKNEIISAPDADGYTALHWAATTRSTEIVLMLIHILAQREGEIQRILSMKTIFNRTPLDLAELSNNNPDDTTEVIRILKFYNH
jgi:ankyrin repeat protein